jgi:putative transposase
MTNHVHFIAIPEKETSLAKAFGEAHRLYTRMKNFQKDVRGYLFQGRFGSCVMDEKHLVAAARYVEQNPIRANIVKTPGDYQWSSARFHPGISPSDILVTDRSMLGLVKDWHELHTSGSKNANEILRTGVRVGRPLGDDAFLRNIENITGLNLHKGTARRQEK